MDRSLRYRPAASHASSNFHGAKQIRPRYIPAMALLIKNGEIVTPSERYTADIFCENETITRIAGRVEGDALRLRCSVPEEALARGGLTIYGAECGRFPICPTLIIDY